MVKKGQSEIFGLLIIVILFAAGIIFAMSVMMDDGDDGQTLQQEYHSAEIAQNYVLALMKTNVMDCKEKSLEELLVDCYYGEYKCENSTYSDSCNFFTNITSRMFNETLEKWGRSFYFTLDRTSRGGSSINIHNYSYRNCTPTMDKTFKGQSYQQVSPPGYVAIPLHPGTINVNLYFCTK